MTNIQSDDMAVYICFLLNATVQKHIAMAAAFQAFLAPLVVEKVGYMLILFQDLPS